MEVLRKALLRMGRIPGLLCPLCPRRRPRLLSFILALGLRTLGLRTLGLFGAALLLPATQLAAQESAAEELLQGLGAPNSQQLQEQMERVRSDSALAGDAPLPLAPPQAEAAPSRERSANGFSSAFNPGFNSESGNLEPLEPNDLQPATPSPPAVPLLSSPLPELIPRMVPSEIPGMIPEFLVEPPTPPSEPSIAAPSAPAVQGERPAAAPVAPVRAPTPPQPPVAPPPIAPSAAVSGIANTPALLPNQQRGEPLKKIDISKRVSMGQPFSVTLHGLIWTYIPALSEYPLEPSFERQLGNLETIFRFEFRRTGRYLLTFSRQYPSTGRLEYYTAEIIVEESEADAARAPVPSENLQLASRPQVREAASQPSFQPLASAQTGTSATMRITTQVINDVRAQLDAGDLDGAYQTLSSWPSDERGDIFDSAGEAFLKAGKYKEAAEMWERNRGLSGDLADKATVGATRAAVQGENFAQLAQWLPGFLQLAKRTATGPREERGALLSDRGVQQKDFASLYQLLSPPGSMQSGLTGGAAELGPAALLDFYQTYIDLYPDSNSPEILYNMALTFEKPGNLQNLRRARDLYAKIRTEYPVDAYNARAKQRLDYLNRQFFNVQ